jgi:hypothetical protein
MRERDEDGRASFHLGPHLRHYCSIPNFATAKIDPMVFVGWTQKYQHHQSSISNYK